MFPFALPLRPDIEEKTLDERLRSFAETLPAPDETTEARWILWTQQDRNTVLPMKKEDGAIRLARRRGSQRGTHCIGVLPHAQDAYSARTKPEGLKTSKVKPLTAGTQLDSVSKKLALLPKPLIGRTEIISPNEMLARLDLNARHDKLLGLVSKLVDRITTARCTDESLSPIRKIRLQPAADATARCTDESLSPIRKIRLQPAANATARCTDESLSPMSHPREVHARHPREVQEHPSEVHEVSHPREVHVRHPREVQEVIDRARCNVSRPISGAKVSHLQRCTKSSFLLKDAADEVHGCEVQPEHGPVLSKTLVRGHPPPLLILNTFL